MAVGGWHLTLARSVESFVEERVAAQNVAHVHVHHTPRCEHRLLIRVVEIRKNVADAAHTLIHMHTVGLASQLAVAFAGSHEHRGVVALAKLVEVGLGYPLGHELRP